jgi:WD40 repeat protein
MSQSPSPLDLVEYLLIGASAIGLIMSLVTREWFLALIPMVFTLVLAAWNRYRAEQNFRRRLAKHNQDWIQQTEQLQQEMLQSRNFAMTLVKQTMTTRRGELPAASGELVDIQLLGRQVSDQQRLMNSFQNHIAGVEGTITNLVDALDGAAIPNRVEYLEQAIVKLSHLAGIDPNEILAIESDVHNKNTLNAATEPLEMLSLEDFALDEISAGLDSDEPEETRMQGSDSGFLKIGMDNPSIDKIAEDLSSGNLLGADPISSDLESGDLWMRPSWDLVTTIMAHTDWVRCLSFTPDSQTLVSGSFDQSIKLWQVADHKLVHELKDHHKGVFALAVSADGRTLASGSWDETIKLWDIATGQLLSNLEGHRTSVRALAASPDNQLLISGSFDNTVRVWQLASGDLLKTMSHDEPIAALALNHTGQILASTSDDGLVKLWSVSSGEVIAQLTGNNNCICSLTISPNSDAVLAGTVSGALVLWALDHQSVKSSEPVQKFKAHSGQINACVFHPSGQYVITGSVDGKARIWSRDQAHHLRDKPRKTLRGEPGRSVMSAAVSTNGNLIAIGGADGSIELWKG